MTAKSYPLHWPAGRPRSRQFSNAVFKDHGKRVSISVACARLQAELDLIGARDVILSTNLETRLDGAPRGGLPEPVDSGAALYFRLAGRDTVLACDKWDRVADNVVAIAKHIEALRGQDRWGVGTLEQAFAGYQALPAPEQWWQVLGCAEDTPQETVERVFRELAKKFHPDRGGSESEMARINAALQASRNRA